MESYQPLSAFDYLLKLAQITFKQAEVSPYHAIQRNDWVGISFLSGNYALLIPLAEVKGILPVTLLAPIPGVKPWLRGMAMYRQDVFPVTDLFAMLTNELTVITRDSRILMCKVKEEYFGLLVSRVLALQRFLYEEVKKSSVKGMPEWEPFMKGMIESSRCQLPIVSFEAIISHPRFHDAALKKMHATKRGNT